jgi:hypothetical protein
MKNVALAVVAVLAVAAGIYSYTLNGRVSFIECHQDLQLCTQACDAAFQTALNALAPDLLRNQQQLMRELDGCGPPIDEAARACRAEAAARAAAEEARIKAAAQAAQFQCVTGCKNRNQRCLPTPTKLRGYIDVDCLASGATCVTD